MSPNNVAASLTPTNSIVFDAFVRQALSEFGIASKNKVRINANWSKKIPEATFVKPVVKLTPGVYYMDIGVSLLKAPHARAFEFGSGIHSTRGERSKYPIKSKKKGGYLAFLWPEIFSRESPGRIFEQFGVSSADQKFVFKEVSHPGVKGVLYLKKSIKESVPTLQQSLGKALKSIIITPL